MKDIVNAIRIIGSLLALAANCLAADPPAPTVKASIVVTHGKEPVVDQIGFGKLLRVSFEDSRHGTFKKSNVCVLTVTTVEPVGDPETDESNAKVWYIVSPPKDGEIVISQTCALNDEFDTATVRIKVGQGPRPPPVPVDPDVKPVDPVVPPGTPVRVLLLKDPKQATTVDQRNAMNSPRAIAILNAKCVKDSAGRPSWRDWDKGEPAANIPAEWKTLHAASVAKAVSYPVLCVEQGQKLTLYELKSETDILSALSKTFGN